MALIGQAVSEEKIFENGGRRTDDGRTTEHGYTISSPCEPDGSGELKGVSARLVSNPIMADDNAELFGCRAVTQVLDSMADLI